jgi:hypothetical protein
MKLKLELVRDLRILTSTVSGRWGENMLPQAELSPDRRTLSFYVDMFTPQTVSSELEMRNIGNAHVLSPGSCEKLRDALHVVETL